MKRFLFAISITILVLLLAYTPTPGMAAEPTITLLNAPPTQLGIGESYTVEILVESDELFALAAVQADVQYPAYIASHGGDRETRATSAVLQLTLTGRRSTSALPGGVTPAEIAVGIIYPGGQIVSERFPFEVAVNN